ncbi:MAG: hypothetical protein ACI8T1_004592 [Verrucomicrobiales bacterium]|jgi:hypothetical protein
MNTNTQPLKKPRKPSDAASLSAMLPGLGHLYCGEFQRGILWMGASIILMIAAVFSLLVSPTRSGFTLAISFLLIDLVVWTVCVIQSWNNVVALRKTAELGLES